MTTLREAAQQALELLQSAHVATALVWPRHDCVEALKAALEQPEKLNQCGETCERAKLCATCARALEQPTRAQKMRDAGFTRRPTIREMSEQPEQEPVAWVNAKHLQGLTLGHYGHAEIYTDESQGRVPLYAHPPRREVQT